MPAPREVLARRLALQAAGCCALGSPFYGALLETAVLDLDREGAVWRALEGFEDESGWAAIALRLMGAVHRLVLDGRAPALARHYPSAGVDPGTEDGALTLRSFVWADQVARMNLLDSALALARTVPVEVERTDAASFVEMQLAKPKPGVATVVYHSVFVQYLDDAGRRRLGEVIDTAASAAPADAPVYRLSMEPNREKPGFDIRLGEELLGTSRAHGTEVRWHVR